MIPPQLQKTGFRFIKLGWQLDNKNIRGKVPAEKDWQNTKNYAWNDSEIQEWLAAGNNIGVATGYNLLFVVDIDSIERYNQVKDKLPATFTVKSGGKGLPHYNYILRGVDAVPNKKVGKDVDLRGLGGQVVCAGSILKNVAGAVIGQYEIMHDLPIADITWDQIKEIFNLEDKDAFADLPSKPTDTTRSGKEFGQLCKMITEGQRNQTLDKDEIFLRMQLFSKWKEGGPAYQETTWQAALKKVNEKHAPGIESPSTYRISEGISLFEDNKLELARRFWNIQPFFYDERQMFWLWNHDNKSWDIVDETALVELLSRDRRDEGQAAKGGFWADIIRAMKIIGRRQQPQLLEKDWVQFKNIIVNIKTGEEKEATPLYFLVNPIPWELGRSEDTPVMDQLFTEWAGPEYKTTLYEILAYCIYSDYPIHVIIALVGRGRNGKSRFIELARRFVGYKNTASTELELLQGRFESSKLFKKLLIIVTETDNNIISRSQFLKKATGQDPIGFEFKGKTGFDEVMYAVWLMATNSLPPTKDDTEGFFRRWLIIDFPNQFPEGKDILESIPQEEYRNLAKKSIRILRELLEAGKFTNQGTIPERQRRYVERSDPLAQFISQFCKKDSNAEILSTEFTYRFQEWLKVMGIRQLTHKQLAYQLEMKGIEKQRLSKSWGEARTYLIGISWRTDMVLHGSAWFSQLVPPEEPSSKTTANHVEPCEQSPIVIQDESPDTDGHGSTQFSNWVSLNESVKKTTTNYVQPLLDPYGEVKRLLDIYLDKHESGVDIYIFDMMIHEKGIPSDVLDQVIRDGKKTGDYFEPRIGFLMRLK